MILATKYSINIVCSLCTFEISALLHIKFNRFEEIYDTELSVRKAAMSTNIDTEKGDDGSLFLVNSTVQDFSWKSLTVTVTDRATREPRQLISDISSSVQQGMVETIETLHPGLMLTLV